MNVSLTKKQTNYIKDQVKSGDYQNASELIRDALRLHQTYREYIIRDLRVEIEKGWNGETSDKTVTDIILEKTKH